MRGELTDRIELFDLDAEDEARARFAELTTGATRPATPRDFMDAFMAAYNDHDVGALTDLYAPDLRVVDRRPIGWGTFEGRDTYVDLLRGAFDLAPDVRIDIAPLALGQRAGLVRALLHGHLAEGGGEFELELVTHGRNGGWPRHVLRGVRPWTDRGGVRAFRGDRCRDPARAIARAHLPAGERARLGGARIDCYGPDHEVIDRRVLGWETLHAPEGIVGMFQSWTEVAPDVDFRSSPSPAMTTTTPSSATAPTVTRLTGGGPMEFVVTAIVTFRDGIQLRAELFAADDEAAALARYEELRSANRPATSDPFRTTRHDSARAPRPLHRRLQQPRLARHARRLRAGFALHRPASGRLGELDSLETLVEFWKGAVELAPDLRIDDGELLAIGRRAVVARYVSRGHFADGGGEVEVQFVTLSVIDDGRVTYGERFEGPDAGAALARFEEIGAETEPERIFARQCRLLSARDWDALADCYAEDYELVDHRALGWEPLRGPAATVEFWRSWIEISPDGEMRFEIVAGDEESILVRQAGHGHAAADSGGGTMESSRPRS